MNKQFNNECIESHNNMRKMHGCDAVQLDEELAKEAQKYAELLAKSNKMEHSNGNDGENLYFKGGSGKVTCTGNEPTESWYSEIKDHNFNGEFTPQSGHFTQVIWKGTKKAGFGMAKTSDGHKIYVVGRYRPAGNVMSQFKQNVPKKI